MNLVASIPLVRQPCPRYGLGVDTYKYTMHPTMP